ncbi:MAG TPA: Gfo/Idh/MocA family oxidoreductase [Bryobacteraceae bacterium]|nr:Gfo/Idh/MocA family oxidoreductase [Bryobacteraceae bacterium]
MPETTRRRQFLGTGGLLLLRPETVFGSAANSALELGIIGCGGRGNWIGGHFVEYTGTRVVAVADPFADRLEASAKKFQVDASRCYRGLQGYRELLASHVDAVAIESPPYFHPEQAAAALEAGKHIYLAKPVAVDVPGCRSILDTGKKAAGKVTFLVDFQTRSRPVFQESARRVHEGQIGTPVMGHVYYHTGRLKPQNCNGLSAAESRLRNWVFDQKLSGDIIVEQHIHVLAVANWYLQGHPVKAVGTGGRKARVDIGDAWDHFIVGYWYPNQVHVDFSSNQFVKGFHDMCIRIYGTGGTMDAHYGGSLRMTGDTKWDGVEKDDTFTGGAVTNVKNFVESVKTGKYLNNVTVSAESNLTAILGRMGAYRETAVSWEEMMRSGEKYEADLRL